jgi:hypothetical protein
MFSSSTCRSRRLLPVHHLRLICAMLPSQIILQKTHSVIYFSTFDFEDTNNWYWIYLLLLPKWLTTHLLGALTLIVVCIFDSSSIPSSSMVLSTCSDSNRVCFKIIVAPPCCFLRAKEHMTGIYSFIFFLSKTTVHVAWSLIFVNCINLMIFMQQDVGYAGCSRARVCRMHVVQVN